MVTICIKVESSEAGWCISAARSCHDRRQRTPSVLFSGALLVRLYFGLQSTCVYNSLFFESAVEQTSGCGLALQPRKGRPFSRLCWSVDVHGDRSTAEAIQHIEAASRSWATYGARIAPMPVLLALASCGWGCRRGGWGPERGYNDTTI
jgi:hypothetical protein